ncbi:MAG: hypothetical protein AB7V55_05270 [Oscillospiraceae bacterium]
MKKIIAWSLVSLLSIAMFAGCGNGGGGQPPGNAASGNKTGDTASVAAGGGEAAQDAEGERIRLEISNEDTKKGYLSAICPADWYDHSDEEYLFFSESETPGDYAKPYVRIGYAPTATMVGGSGEDIEFEMGGKNWEGLHNKEYNTYQVSHQLDIGGGLLALSMGLGPDDAIYQLVVGSIWVEF